MNIQSIPSTQLKSLTNHVVAASVFFAALAPSPASASATQSPELTESRDAFRTTVVGSSEQSKAHKFSSDNVWAQLLEHERKSPGEIASKAPGGILFPFDGFPKGFVEKQLEYAKSGGYFQLAGKPSDEVILNNPEIQSLEKLQFLETLHKAGASQKQLDVAKKTFSEREPMTEEQLYQHAVKYQLAKAQKEALKKVTVSKEKPKAVAMN